MDNCERSLKPLSHTISLVVYAIPIVAIGSTAVVFYAFSVRPDTRCTPHNGSLTQHEQSKIWIIESSAPHESCTDLMRLSFAEKSVMFPRRSPAISVVESQDISSTELL